MKTLSAILVSFFFLFSSPIFSQQTHLTTIGDADGTTTNTWTVEQTSSDLPATSIQQGSANVISTGNQFDANCPTTLTLLGIVSPGIYKAKSTIISSATLNDNPSGGIIQFMAGDQIDLLDNFYADGALDFEVSIANCN